MLVNGMLFPNSFARPQYTDAQEAEQEMYDRAMEEAEATTPAERRAIEEEYLEDLDRRERFAEDVDPTDYEPEEED